MSDLRAPSPYFLDAAVAGDVFGILFWGFLAAALIWLVLWMLLSDREADAIPSVMLDRDQGSARSAQAQGANLAAAARETTVLAPPATDKASKEKAPPKAVKSQTVKSEGQKSEQMDSKKEESTSSPVDPALMDTASAEEAAAAFQAELENGEARQDEVKGILYNDSPSEIDDLKLIKGVAKVLEGRLHENEVYRFKQIAYWTDEAAQEFGKLLSFRDRIFRDDWIAQAKKFHAEKYGEEL